MTLQFVKILVVFVVSVLCVIFLWEQRFLLSMILILLFLVKHKISPIQKEYPLFFTIFVLSYLVEIMLVNIGKAWEYSSYYFLNVPIWASLFWGIIGVSSLSVYNLIFKSSKKS